MTDADQSDRLVLAGKTAMFNTLGDIAGVAWPQGLFWLVLDLQHQRAGKDVNGYVALQLLEGGPTPRTAEVLVEHLDVDARVPREDNRISAIGIAYRAHVFAREDRSIRFSFVFGKEGAQIGPQRARIFCSVAMLGEFLLRSMQEMIPGVTPARPANWRIDRPQRFRSIWMRWATSESMLLCSVETTSNI